MKRWEVALLPVAILIAITVWAVTTRRQVECHVSEPLMPVECVTYDRWTHVTTITWHAPNVDELRSMMELLRR